MTVLAIISIVNTYSFFLIGVYVLRLNRAEILNRLAAAVYFSFGIWSLFYTFLYIAPTAEYAMLWHRIGSIGWGMFSPLATHFFILLSAENKKGLGFRKAFLLYLLPVMIILNALFNPSGTSVTTGFQQGPSGMGWIYISPGNSVWYWLYALNIIIYFAYALKKLHDWAVASGRLRFIKQAKSVIVLDTLVLVTGGSWDLLLPAINIKMPPACNFVAFIWALIFLLIIRKLKLMKFDDAVTPDIILKTVQDPILVLNSKGTIIKCNQATEDMLKLDRSRIINKRLSDFFKSRITEKENIDKLLRDKIIRNAETDIIDSLGQTINTRLSISLAESRLDGQIGFVANLHDVTALKEVEYKLSERNKKYKKLSRHLETLANYDELTGLPNRRVFNDKIDLALSDYKSTEKKFALIFIDLDRFKEVNDLYGHDTGDKLLITVSKIFQSVIRKTDFVTRVGGDEFILYIEMHDDREIERIVGRLRNSFVNAINIDGCACDVGISLGISRCPEDGIKRNDLIKIADNRMYKNKKGKR